MSLLTIADTVSAAQTILDTVSREAEIARMISEGDPRVMSLNTFNKQNIVRTQLVAHVWRKIGRQVLAMHPAVVDEVKIASSDKIPGEVLRTLPYMNPLVVFAEPPEFKTWLPPGVTHHSTGKREDKMRLLGFFTYGTTMGLASDTHRAEQRIYPTNSPEAKRFGIMLVAEVLDERGQVIDLEMNSVTLFFNQDQTLSETIDDLMVRFHWDADSTVYGDQVQGRGRKWMREVLSVVVGSLFYLCSTTLEAEKIPTRATRHVGKVFARKPISVYRVGWTTGAALTRYRQSRPSVWNESQQADISHEQDPQHRRAHFKMQPYGPNRSLRKLIFVSAYWTHIEQLGEMGMNTARKVPLAAGKGSARESTQVALSMRGMSVD